MREGQSMPDLMESDGQIEDDVPVRRISEGININRAKLAMEDFKRRASCYNYYIQSVPADKMADVVIDIAGVHETGSVLDLACGTGSHLKHYPKNISRCGLDLCKQMLLKADGNISHRVQAHACALPFQDMAFDAVVCFGAINTFDNCEIELLLKEVARVLDDSGCFIADAPVSPHPSTPDRLLYPLLRSYNLLISSVWRCHVTIPYHNRDLESLKAIFKNHFDKVETSMRYDLIRMGMGSKSGVGFLVGRR